MTHPLHQRMLARMPRQDRWYEIKNLDGPHAVVRIYDEIGYFGVTADDFAADLERITAPAIEVQINSPGGEVFAAIAIFNALRMHPARITTRVDGIAASAASIIAQAGDHRAVVSGGQMMIHDARGIAIGPAQDMRDFADLLDRQSDVLAGIYAERSGGDAEHFRGLMAAETWLTGDEAVELGLADEVLVPDRQPTASILQPPTTTTTTNTVVITSGTTAAPQIPPTGESEDPPTSTGEPTVVDPEMAARLLGSLTMKEQCQ